MALEVPLLAVTAIMTVGYQLLFFFIAFGLQFDKVTDFAGSTNFLLNAVLTMFLPYIFDNADFTLSDISSRKIVATAMVAVWALRLGAFLFLRVLKAGDDKRFEEMRSKFFAFLGFWILQILWVWVVGLPVTYLNSLPDSEVGTDVGSGHEVAGIVIFVIGFVWEAVADQQRFHHRFCPERRRRVLNTGLWRFSRQPNYFGDIFLWWGVYIFCITPSTPSTYAMVVSPLFIACLLLFVSGMPLAELGSQSKFLKEPQGGPTEEWKNSRDEYLRYRATTSPLIPMPPGVYDCLPEIIKKVFFFEFDLYAGPFLKEREARLLSG